MKQTKAEMTLTQKSTQSFYHWLAGFTDGAGYFYVDSKNHPRFEITTALNDEHVLQRIKQFFPGSLKIRSGAQTIRLRISQKQILQDLISAVNGKIRYPKRQLQLQTLCVYFGISFQSPESFCFENAYLAGLLDSAGTITITVSKSSSELSIEKGVEGRIHRLQYSGAYHQLKCQITSIDIKFLEDIAYGCGFGKIYSQKANKQNRNRNTIHHWTCQSEKEINSFLNYIQKYKLRSQKRKRFFLIPKYLVLKSQKAHLCEDGSMQKKAWFRFCRKWFQG